MSALLIVICAPGVITENSFLYTSVLLSENTVFQSLKLRLGRQYSSPMKIKIIISIFGGLQSNSHLICLEYCKRCDQCLWDQLFCLHTVFHFLISRSFCLLCDHANLVCCLLLSSCKCDCLFPLAFFSPSLPIPLFLFFCACALVCLFGMCVHLCASSSLFYIVVIGIWQRSGTAPWELWLPIGGGSWWLGVRGQ